MKRKLTVCLLLAVIAVSLFAGHISAGAASDMTWSIENGVLTVNGTGSIGGYDYASSRSSAMTTAPWDMRGGEVTSIVIGEGITYIGQLAFSTMPNVEEITLPSTLTGYYRCINPIYAAFDLRYLTRINFNGTLDQWIMLQGVGSRETESNFFSSE